MDGQSEKPHDQDRPDDDYEAASRATGSTTDEEYEEYSRHAAARSHKTSSSVRKMLIIASILVLLAAGGFGIYWFLLRDTGSKPARDAELSQVNPPLSSEQTSTEGITTKTEHYVSDSFTLELDYPEDWKATETAGSGQLIVQSPALQLEGASGGTVTGRVVFKVRNKQQPLPEFDNGNAVAVHESEKINYTRPSSVQRGSTYLSFLRYATASSGLSGVYITGDYGYQKDQAIPKADFVPVDPIISVTFEQCADDTCDGQGMVLSISDAMWQDESFSKPLKSLFQSLVIN